MPTTSLRVITIVVLAIAIDATIGLAALSYCLIFGISPDPTLITAYVGLTSGAFGALTGLLVNTRTMAGASTEPPAVQIQQPVGEPVPVETQPSKP